MHKHACKGLPEKKSIYKKTVKTKIGMGIGGEILQKETGDIGTNQHRNRAQCFSLRGKSGPMIAKEA